MGRREAQGLSILFLVNPTGERSGAEEEIASLCTMLPEPVTRIILYRQQANQLEMRMRISADTPQILHYAGPLALAATGTSEPALALAGNSRLDSSAVEQLFQALPKRPLVFLSYHEDERQTRNGNAASSQQERDETMARLATSLLMAGAGAVVSMRWPINTQRAREVASLFYQEVADGVALGEALRRTRSALAQHRPEDTSWMSYVLYGDPSQRLVSGSLGAKERPVEPRFDLFDDSHLIPSQRSLNAPDRRFLRSVFFGVGGDAKASAASRYRP